MISRSNEYKIVIATATQSTTSLMNVHIPYIGSASFKDHLVITNSKIELICRRSAKVKLDDIFYNNNSSLYQQITKALLCYYGLVRKYYPIVSIKIERSGMQGILETYIRSELEISQPLEPSYVLHYKLSETALQNILQETDKATLLRNALSHYLVANAKENEIQRFEKLWKSFNAVYKAMTGKNTDKDALIELRIFALQNKGNLIHSNKVSKIITFQDLDKLRWRALIFNDYPGVNKTVDFIGFVKRYSDERILSCMKDREFANQKHHLNINQTNDLQNHIANNKNPKTVDDTELTIFLTGKYGYFMRNKNFHGEKIDSEFKLSANKEKIEFIMVNKVLDAYIADLFNLS